MACSLRQTDLPPKNLHPRVASKQGKLRIGEILAYAPNTEGCHAIQSLERPVFVSKAGVSQHLYMRPSSLRRHFLRVRAPPRSGIGVTEKARVGVGRVLLQNSDG